MVKNTIFDLIETSWPTLVIFLVIVIILRLFYFKNSSKKMVLHEELIFLVFITYILLLFELVTSKDVGFNGINLVPFKEIFRYEIGSTNFYKQVIGNIVLFIPFGFFATYYTNVKKISSSALITFFVSLTIEIVQKYIGRSFDIDDIILNVIGGVLGFMIYIALKAVGERLPSFFRKDGFLSFLSLLILVFVVLYLLGYIVI